MNNIILSPASWVLAFHRGGGEPNIQSALMGRWIRAWTRSDNSHVELICPVDVHKGESFSASGYDNLVRWKFIRYSNPARWGFLQLPDEYLKCSEAILGRIRPIVGAGYDYWGAMWANRNNPRMQISGRWYCYEAVRYALGWSPYQGNGRALVREALAHGGVPIDQEDL